MTILLENSNEASGHFSISAHVKRLGCAMALTALAISARADLIGEETRLAFDVSTRINLNQVNDRSSMLHFLGIDFFKTFSVNGRDVGTLLLQPYLIRAVHLSPHPGLFDDPNDVALQFRNLYYRLPPMFNRSMQISIGHVELPYGLEREYETNQTLQQFNNAVDGGHKTDWGLMLDGAAGKMKYDVTLTRGSGNEWRNDGDPYLLTARFSTEMDHWYNLGLTVVQGELWQGSGLTSERDRVAVDGRIDVRRWTFKGQISNGHNGPIDARRSLLEVEWTYGFSEWTAYLQRFVFELGNQNFDQETHSLGIRFEPTNHLQMDVDYSKDASNFGKPNREMIRTQIRVRL
jgi:hypothetical protein